MKEYTAKTRSSPGTEPASAHHTPAGIPNSAMTALLGGGGYDPSGGVDEAMQRRIARLRGYQDNQIPTAEREADQLAAPIGKSGSPDEVKSAMGDRMGADFSDVRFHTDAAAAQKADDMGARAYTTGRDVYFDGDGFDPAVAAHELVHTAQQGAVTSAAQVRSAPAGGAQMKFKGVRRLFSNLFRYGRFKRPRQRGPTEEELEEQRQTEEDRQRKEIQQYRYKGSELERQVTRRDAMDYSDTMSELNPKHMKKHPDTIWM